MTNKEIIVVICSILTIMIIAIGWGHLMDNIDLVWYLKGGISFLLGVIIAWPVRHFWEKVIDRYPF